jgi:demethylmenaquinone methyltransferase/2-methoxy-6-polyprenyl-1,4-benzoquinol methylase
MNDGLQKIYSEIPETYEVINHILTLGQDILWRRKAARLAASGGGQRWLDACSGTGEMAVNLKRLAAESIQLYAADFSMPMMRQAMAKEQTRAIRFNAADMRFLPFNDNSLDLITISFATRNLNITRESLLQSFREFHRVLKPGGRFINVETSQPPVKIIRSLFHLYVALFIRPVGALISGNRVGYDYLSRSIRGFYGADELKQILHESGFEKVTFQRLMTGAAAIHRSVK